MTPPKRPSFGSFTPIVESVPQQIFLADFAGVSPAEAAKRLVKIHRDRVELRDVTARQKEADLRRILTDFQQRGKDLGSITPDDVSAYRQYLDQLIKDGVISRNYAAHDITQWNAMLNVVFGDKPQRNDMNLKMRTIQQTPKETPTLTCEDFEAMRSVVPQMRFQVEHYREIFRMYLGVIECLGARIGSLLTPKFQVQHIDWHKKTVVFKHMKNKPEHEAVLTDAAAEALRSYVAFLASTPQFKGPETPVCVGPRGSVVTYTWIYTNLRKCAAMAGIDKPVATHTARKSVGKRIGADNQHIAAEQLGVTMKIFQQHYAQPDVTDRIRARHLLPGAMPEESNPWNRLGQAYWKFQQGLLTRTQLDQVVANMRPPEIVENPRISQTM